MAPNNESMIVFGGAGFIGHHLLKSLLLNTTQPLISVDIKDPKYPVAGVKYVRADVRDLSNFTVDGVVATIYNLAAVHTTPGHPEHEYYETNVLGANEVTAFARRHNIKTIVFTSSISVYGPSEERKDETTPVAPTSAYGRSKYLAERIHKAWFNEDETRRLVVVRPAVVFGPYEGGNFTRMASLLKKGFFIYPGREDTIKACFYVGDLIQALSGALKSKENYILFNGCYPTAYTIKQIVQTFKAQYFPTAREFKIPYFVVRSLALLLAPFSLLGLGIHPDRVTKLTRSTDINPGWLMRNGLAKPDGLKEALLSWGKESKGSFK